MNFSAQDLFAALSGASGGIANSYSPVSSSTGGGPNPGGGNPISPAGGSPGGIQSAPGNQGTNPGQPSMPGQGQPGQPYPGMGMGGMFNDIMGRYPGMLAAMRGQGGGGGGMGQRFPANNPMMSFATGMRQGMRPQQPQQPQMSGPGMGQPY